MIQRSVQCLFAGLLLAFGVGCAGTCPSLTQPGKGVRTILLVRHGAYVEDEELEARKVLTPQGRKQAQLTGKRLAELPIKLDEVITSPVQRSRETAQIACREFGRVQPVVDEELAECGPPQTGEASAPNPATEMELVCREHLDHVYGRYFRPTPDRDTAVVLFCHGNVIRYLWCKALGVDPGVWPRLKVSNCHVTEIRVQADGTVVPVSYNDVGHLPPACRTFSWRRQMYQP